MTAESVRCICSYGNTLHGDWVRVQEDDCPAHKRPWERGVNWLIDRAESYWRDAVALREEGDVPMAVAYETISRELRAAADHYCVFGWHHPAGEECDCCCSFCKAAHIDGTPT